MKTQIEQFQTLEHQLALTDDAVIHKAMQETLEFVEAVHKQDKGQIIGEAKDAITNVLSAHYRLSNETLQVTGAHKQSTALQLAISIGKRNDTVQKYRNIYSRSPASKQSLTQATNTVVTTILGLTKDNTGTTLDIKTALQDLTDKFGQRIDSYSSKIDIKQYIRDVPNFPKPGITFKDIAPLLQNPKALHHTIHQLSTKVKDADVIVGLDARGFIFGAAVAHYLGKPFIMVRKKGKLPGKTIEEGYDLEYGSSTQAIQQDSIQTGQRVAIIDDVLATGGTAAAACKLIQKVGGILQGCYFVIELDQLGGRDLLGKVTASSIVHY
ncbi:MAG: adenine phosphoribosyltransferase [Candidatus Absconditabacterales bacterium]